MSVLSLPLKDKLSSDLKPGDDKKILSKTIEENEPKE